MSERRSMHLLKNNTVLISPIDERIINRLQELGANVIKCNPIEHLIDYEKYHADMQLLIVSDTAFISSDSVYLQNYLKDKYNVIVVDALQSKYPNNILLNAIYIDGYLICKEYSVAHQLIEYAKNNHIKILNTNQGYSRCNALILKNRAVITSDPSICKATACAGINTLKIASGSIYLDDNNYGFIGGASGVIGDTVLFFGDIRTHPDYKRITEFIKNEGMEYICLCDGVLKDIGGLVGI